MAIQVTCPGCLKRFSVADEHAGKQGPCPNCQKTITIPKLEDQVVIHEAPSGPVDAKGRSVLKTYRRQDGKFSPLIAGAAVGVTAVALLVAFLLRGQVDAATTQVLVLLGVLAALFAPFVVVGGYQFLRDDELEPYRGTELWLRAAACGVVFAGSWFLFGYILSRFATPEEIAAGLQFWQLLIPLAVMFMVGVLAAYAALDLEPASGVMLFALFFISTALLRVVMGLPFVPGLVLGGS